MDRPPDLRLGSSQPLDLGRDRAQADDRSLEGFEPRGEPAFFVLQQDQEPVDLALAVEESPEEIALEVPGNSKVTEAHGRAPGESEPAAEPTPGRLLQGTAGAELIPAAVEPLQLALRSRRCEESREW